jgi:hypothetical protein
MLRVAHVVPQEELASLSQLAQESMTSGEIQRSEVYTNMTVWTKPIQEELNGLRSFDPIRRPDFGPTTTYTFSPEQVSRTTYKRLTG